MELSEINKRQLTLDDLRHENDDGVEFWYARELMRLLGYAQWRNFEEAIRRAIDSCETSKTPVERHFAEVSKSLPMPKGGYRVISDFMLTRYACYLIAMNGDTRKEEIAFAQSYFAMKTRSAELISQRMADLRRLVERDALRDTETHFAAVAFERDVNQREFAVIKSKGDAALFGGNDTRAMKKKLGISPSRPLADGLSGIAVVAKNLATSMTAFNVEQQDLHGAKPIEGEHVANNESVRGALVSRGIRPEDLPAEEDVYKVARRIKADERNLRREVSGFSEQND